MTATAVCVVIGGRREVAYLPASLVVYRDGGRSKTREEGRCRLCLRASSVRRLTRHHIVPKRFCRLHGIPAVVRDCDANVVPLCVPCHEWVERVGDDEGRRMLRKVLGAVEAAFAIRVRGRDWFDSRYPGR